MTDGTARNWPDVAPSGGYGATGRGAVRAATLHERLAVEALQDYLADPGSAHVLSGWVRRHRDDPAAVMRGFALYGQTHPRAGRWPIEQLAAAVYLHGEINAGRFACCPIDVGVGPDADRERAANATALVDLRFPFVAGVDMNQNGADSDGHLSWSRRIPLVKSTGVALLDPLHGHEPLMVPRWVDEGVAPLEIGYTKPSRTAMHLTEHGAVARWPYGPTYLVLIVDLDPPRLGL